MTSSDIFTASTIEGPPSNIPVRTESHPQAKLGISQSGPIETNKFYGNLLLGSQSLPVWTIPYSISWSKGGGATESWGMSVVHTEETQLSLGNRDPTTGAVSFYANPGGLQDVVLSASELGVDTALTTDSLTAFSANCNLTTAFGSDPLLTFPLCQGMAFVTAIYRGATPLIQSGSGIGQLDGPTSMGSTTKYLASIGDGLRWLIYVRPDGSGYDPGCLKLQDGAITANKDFHGILQLAKSPAEELDVVYDKSAGVYPTSMNISASVSDSTCSYTFRYKKAGGLDSPLLTFALAHHIASFDETTKNSVQELQLRSPTKGMTYAVAADSWTMVESLPTSIGFDPWSPDPTVAVSLSDTAKSTIISAANTEMSESATEQCSLDSMYYSGKALAKWAQMVYVVTNLAPDDMLKGSGLKQLEAAFDVFVQNQQINPLTYDTTWKGIVSTAGLSGDSGQDFGNSYYNDHHFHYGYFMYAAAVIASLDPDWLNQGSNKDYVNALARDFASPVTDDYFPFSRSFDWYHGHSWAKGLFESGDGKDQESSSEDAYASYGLKMWGKATGDANQEARGNLMLAVQARSFQTYFLMTSNNAVQPPDFIGNKADGILFENKIDHTTYFGGNPEYVEGIHMIPISPCSKLIRTDTFVSEEWKVYFNNGRAQAVEGGWQGLLMANLALVDPVTSYNFFASENFDTSLLDGGASRTWYLTFAAMLGGESQASAPVASASIKSISKWMGKSFGSVGHRARKLGPKLLCSGSR